MNDILSIIEASKSCANVEDLLLKSKLTDEDTSKVELHTRDQSSNPHRKKLRNGRITASNFYKVHSRVKSLRKKPTLDCSSLFNSLLNPTDLSHLAQIRTGSALEPEAIQALITELEVQGHTNVKIRNCGLYIHKSHQFIGASPDGIQTCDCCCKPKLVEIKCPTKSISSLPYLDSRKALKKKCILWASSGPNVSY